jgi:hypothetical protein
MFNESMSHEMLLTCARTWLRWSPNSKILCHVKFNIFYVSQILVSQRKPKNEALPGNVLSANQGERYQPYSSLEPPSASQKTTPLLRTV